jgi:hypothetical protein
MASALEVILRIRGFLGALLEATALERILSHDLRATRQMAGLSLIE